MLSTMKVVLKVMLNNVQVLEWEKVAEDWIRAGRKLMLLHYEEVANVLSNIEFYIVGNSQFCWAPYTEDHQLSDLPQLSQG